MIITLKNKFEYLNTKAGEIAKKAKDLNSHILIAGLVLPPQDDTYIVDERDDNIIKSDFYDQAKILKSIY